VTIPPGHKVVVIRAAPRQHLGRTESGIFIADFGPTEDSENLFQAAESLLKQHPKAPIIWIVPQTKISSLTSDPQVLTQWLMRFHSVRRLRVDQTTGDVAVCDRSVARAEALMGLLRDIGIGVHETGPDGEAFVEVHRPDGIAVGMPGAAFSAPNQGPLLQLFRELADQVDSDDDSKSLHQRATQYVAALVAR
jgi:hypothetical protein